MIYLCNSPRCPETSFFLFFVVCFLFFGFFLFVFMTQGFSIALKPVLELAPVAQASLELTEICLSQPLLPGHVITYKADHFSFG